MLPLFRIVYYFYSKFKHHIISIMINRAETIIKILLVLCVIQVVFTICFAIKVFLLSSVRSPVDSASDYGSDYDLMDGLNDDTQELIIEGISNKEGEDSWLVKKLNDDSTSSRRSLPIVEVWSKAAIGTYLWQHILNCTQEIDEKIPGTYIGHLKLADFNLVYREGPGLIPNTVPYNVESLVLIINGRTDEKITTANVWLDYLKSLKNPPNTIITMLGNEKCNNRWIDEYISTSPFIKAVLLTYDDPIIDDIFYYQWPLGVATYRLFPDLKAEQVRLDSKRKYTCNFQATVYENSSRVTLLQQLQSIHEKDTCFVAARQKWQPTESPDSMNNYIWSLVQSDLTLCPSGLNAETYRVYEAMACGSVPVIEDSAGEGACHPSSWRLLKKYNPPVIWVNDWTTVKEILNLYKRRSLKWKQRQRYKVFQWYKFFKLKIKNKLFEIIRNKLLVL